MNAVAAMKHYKQVSVHSNLMDASPHRLVQMLMEGVLEKVAEAKGNMINQYIAKKGKDIGTAITIIAGLQSSLNKEAGGEVAENLDNLYDYMCRRQVGRAARARPCSRGGMRRPGRCPRLAGVRESGPDSQMSR